MILLCNLSIFNSLSKLILVLVFLQKNIRVKRTITKFLFNKTFHKSFLCSKLKKFANLAKKPNFFSRYQISIKT